MINVNWSKIKKYEKKPFAIGTVTALAAVGLVLLVFCFIKATLPPVRILCSLLITFLFGFYVHIESRMLQIYAVMGVMDVLLFFSAFMLCPKPLSIVMLVVLILATVGIVLFSKHEEKRLNAKTKYKGAEPNRANAFGNKNVMMFAPHEDDEINLYGGIIEQYVQHGSTVRIVFYTNGDCYGLGKLRVKEALNVADKYHIPRENIIFLGYGDSLIKDGRHIYNCEPDEVVKSAAGAENTYATDEHPPFSESQYTRANILVDFENVIEQFKPDVLFCCDYDEHCDHRAISLFFEEAMDNVLKRNSDYKPKVYKGFAYSTAWAGKQDYYSLNAPSTALAEEQNLMKENNTYLWAERVRFPVAKKALSRVLQNSSSYKAMMEYSSQTATDHARGILNSDKVFWERRCDSLLLNASVAATSGNADSITGFKLVDSNDICNKELIPSANAWVAHEDDDKRIVMISLGEPKSIGSIRIYESPELGNNIINATVQIGTKQFKTGAFEADKRSATFCFEPITADKLAIRVDEFEGKCSILKIEAFEQGKESVQWVKLVNANNDFCYDYYINENGEEAFDIYTYPQDAECEFKLEFFGDIEAKLTDGRVYVKCLPGHKGTIKLSTDNEDIYDEIKVSNPTAAERKEMLSKQKFEQRVMSLPMQKDYYYGLIKRLGVYR